MTITLLKLGIRRALTTFLHKGQTGGFMVDTFSKQIGAPSDDRETLRPFSDGAGS